MAVVPLARRENSGKRKAKSEKRKAKSEKRKAKSEKRKAKSEKRLHLAGRGRAVLDPHEKRRRAGALQISLKSELQTE